MKTIKFESSLTQKFADKWLDFKRLKVINVFSCTNENDRTLSGCHPKIKNKQKLIIQFKKQTNKELILNLTDLSNSAQLSEVKWIYSKNFLLHCSLNLNKNMERLIT